MDDHVVLAGIGEHQHADRGHPAGETERVFGAVPHREAIFEDLLVGRVEARIDETVRAARALAGDAFEMALAVGGAGEGEGRGKEDRRLEAAFGQHRVIAIAHHQRAGLEFAPVDLGDFGLGCHARRGRVDIVVAHRRTSFLISAPRKAGAKADGPRRPFLTSAGTLLRRPPLSAQSLWWTAVGFNCDESRKVRHMDRGPTDKMHQNAEWVQCGPSFAVRRSSPGSRRAARGGVPAL